MHSLLFLFVVQYNIYPPWVYINKIFYFYDIILFEINPEIFPVPVIGDGACGKLSGIVDQIFSNRYLLLENTSITG
ncbi:hypothetical protein CDO33_03240 [Clostridium thermosuccinogenes]|nr:hypothetical protein CDO33_03240 [Pseudoclostridium thermosuccinogenes]